MKTLIVLALLLSLSHCAYADLVLGTNCGFLTSSPVADPATGAQLQIDTYARAVKFTSPPDMRLIEEFGWWCSNATADKNWEMALYDHDAANNRPGDRIVTTGAIAKGVGAGWIESSKSLSWLISANTTYWIALQLDENIGDQTDVDYKPGGDFKEDSKNAQVTLADPWGVSDDTGVNLLAIYALYTPGTVTRMQGCTLQGATIQ